MSSKPKASAKKKAAAPKRTAANVPKPPASRRPKRPARAPMAAAIPADLVEHFGEEVVTMTRAELPVGATERDLYRLLAEAKRLGADPARDDVYLTRGASRDGSTPEYSVAAKLAPLQRFVERAPGYRGHDEAAIFVNDEFQQGEASGKGDTLRERAGVRHTTGHPKDRGELWGAWCAVEIEGQPPTVRVIEADRYIGTAQEREQLEPDDPRRRYPDACVIAAAMSLTFRRSTGLNDVIGADELKAPRTPAAPARVAQASSGDADRTREPLDELDQYVLGEFRRATGYTPGLWPRAKVRTRLLECTDDDARRALAHEIHITTSAAIERRLVELNRFNEHELDEDEAREWNREVATLTDALGQQELAAATA